MYNSRLQILSSLLSLHYRSAYDSFYSIQHLRATTVHAGTPSKCYKNWSQSSCARESDIIVRMDGLRYMWIFSDGDSSVYSSVCIGVPYSRFVQKVEWTNHAIWCYYSALGKPAKGITHFSGRKGLTAGKIQHLSKGMKCAIKQHSSTGVALQTDLHNCPRNCFGDHQQCNSSFCKNASVRRTCLHIHR